MEETPICASVERDLDINVDELIGGMVATTPPRRDEAALPVPAPAEAAEGVAQQN